MRAARLEARRPRRGAAAVHCRNRALRAAACLALGCAGLLLAAPSVQAFIPDARRVARAAAKTNVSSSRTRALQIELNLRIAGSEPVAKGELVIHPQGLARLELRASGDQLIERHVLQGTEHRASRNGQPLDDPRAFLPPLFLLQADTGTTLRAALRSYGVDVDAVGLALCGQADCYVIGDPARVPPPWEPPDPMQPEGPDTTLDIEPPERERRRGRDSDAPRARIWMDATSYEILRLDFPDGVVIRLGPRAVFEKVRFPSWILIEEPERRPARFEVLRAVPVNAPAALFGSEWLLDPTTAPEPAAHP